MEVSLKVMETSTRALSYMTYPFVLIPLEILSVTVQILNPFSYTLFTIIKLALSILVLGMTAKYSSDGTLAELSNHLYAYAQEAKKYIQLIMSKGRNTPVVFFKKILPENSNSIFYKPVCLINSAVYKLSSLVYCISGTWKKEEKNMRELLIQQDRDLRKMASLASTNEEKLQFLSLAEEQDCLLEKL